MHGRPVCALCATTGSWKGIKCNQIAHIVSNAIADVVFVCLCVPCEVRGAAGYEWPHQSGCGEDQSLGCSVPQCRRT